jgi:Protein of unknown function (DUF3887)
MVVSSRQDRLRIAPEREPGRRGDVMPELPDRPNLDQLRRQARELLRAAASGEPNAAAKLRAVSERVTLAAAQLALAREYGYRSWPALKADAERRRQLSETTESARLPGSDEPGSPDMKDRVRVLFGDLIAGRWETVYREFDVSLRGQVDVIRFAEAWTRTVDSAGSFEQMGASSIRQSGDYTLVDVPLTFAAGKAIAQVVFAPEGKIAGVALKYPRRRRLDPRRVRFFVLRNPEIAKLLPVR